MEGKGTRGAEKDLVPAVTISHLYYPDLQLFPLCLLTSLWLACSPMNFGRAETVKVRCVLEREDAPGQSPFHPLTCKILIPRGGAPSLTRAIYSIQPYFLLPPPFFFWKAIPGNRTCLSLKQAI